MTEPNERKWRKVPSLPSSPRLDHNKKPVPTRERVITELNDRIKKKELEISIAARDNGTDSIDFLWIKCEIETIESVLYLLDPNYDLHDPVT